jgi:hypothetical protein
MHVSLWGFCDEVSAPQNGYALFFFRNERRKKKRQQYVCGIRCPHAGRVGLLEGIRELLD